MAATLASDAPAQVLASNKQRRQLTMMMVMGRMRGRMVRRIRRMSLGSVMRRGGGGGRWRGRMMRDGGVGVGG